MRWPLPWPKSWRARGTDAAGLDAEGEGTADDDEEAEEEPTSLKRSALLLARDVVLAFAVVGLVMLLLVAYARVWPPMVVVESGSMEHNQVESLVGAIDTGDLVLVQDVGVASDVVTYAEGRVRGYETYSNYGDVIVFYKPGDDLTSTPIIHRAILYVTPNASGGADIPSLAEGPKSAWFGLRRADWQPASTPFGLGNITLIGVRSWHADRAGERNPSWNLSAIEEAGFLTKGDHNGDLGDQWGSSVPVSRILGKARGELPWFGLIKLTLSPGRSGCCPDGWGDARAAKNSWDALLVALILIIAGPFVVDYGWAWYMGRRKAKRQAARTTPEPSGGDMEAIEPNGSADPTEVPSGTVPDASPDSPPSPEPEITVEPQTESSAPEDGDL